MKHISWSPGGKQVAIVVGDMLWLSQFGSNQPARFLANTSKDGLTYDPIWSLNERFTVLLRKLYAGFLTFAHTLCWVS